MARSHGQALLRRVSFSGRRQIFRRSPRIAVLLQTMHDIIGNSVALFFRQLLAKTADKFARAKEVPVWCGKNGCKSCCPPTS